MGKKCTHYFVLFCDRIQVYCDAVTSKMMIDHYFVDRFFRVRTFSWAEFDERSEEGSRNVVRNTKIPYNKQPLLWKTNSCIAAKYIEIGTNLQNTHHSSFFLHKLGFLTLWKNQSFIQSQLPKGITYVGANASQGCLIKHPHLCKWYLYSELITKRYHLRRCRC